MKTCMNGGCTAQNNDEFRAWLKQRNRKLIVFPILGVFAIVFGVLNELFAWIPNDHMSGVVSGMGSGLLGAGIVMGIMIHRTMKDEERLRKMRLKYTDERNQSVSRQALATTAYITIFACCLGLLISGWFSDVAFWCFYGMMFFVILCYLACVAYYNRKM